MSLFAGRISSGWWRSSDDPPLKRTRQPGIFEAGRSYVVRYRDHSGRQRQRTCRTLDEAKRLRAKVILNPAASTPRSGPTVSEYAEEWLGMLVGVRPGTAIEYRRDLERYILPRIGAVRMGALDARKIRRLAYDLREERTARAPSGRSWSTVRRILAPFSVMLSAASEDGLIPAKPWPRLPNATARPDEAAPSNGRRAPTPSCRYADARGPASHAFSRRDRAAYLGAQGAPLGRSGAWRRAGRRRSSPSSTA